MGEEMENYGREMDMKQEVSRNFTSKKSTISESSQVVLNETG